MKYIYTPLQKLAIKGLILFIPVSALNSWLVIFKELYGVGDDYWFATAFPFFTMFFSFISCIVYFQIRFFFLHKITKDWQYVKDHYPQIFEKLDPLFQFGKYSKINHYNFLKGKFDDGKDEKLNQIKFSIKATRRLLVIAFILAIFGVFISMAMIVVKEGGIRVNGNEYIIKF